MALPFLCIFEERFSLPFSLKKGLFFHRKKFKERNLTKLFPMLNVSPLFKMNNSLIFMVFAGVKCDKD